MRARQVGSLGEYLHISSFHDLQREMLWPRILQTSLGGLHCRKSAVLIKQGQGRVEIQTTPVLGCIWDLA